MLPSPLFRGGGFIFGGKNMQCLRCQTEMEHLSDEEIQLGHQSFLLGSLSNLLSGALKVKIYVCPNCKKLEFFYVKD